MFQSQAKVVVTELGCHISLVLRPSMVLDELGRRVETMLPGAH